MLSRRCCCALVFLYAFVFIAGSTHAQSVKRDASNSPEGDTIAKLSTGTVSGNIYSNSDLGIRYEFPKGWATNDKPTQQRAIAEGRQLVWVDDSDPKQNRKTKTRQCSKDLLVVTQYPEDMLVNEFNPMVQMIAADPLCAPEATFPATVEDQRSIQRVASQLGMYFKTASVTSRGASQIHAYNNDGHVILEVSQRLTIYNHQPGVNTVQEIRTSVFIAEAGKCFLMWMLAGGDDGQLARLRASRIIFNVNGPN